MRPTERLNKHGIHNNWEISSRGSHVWVEYRARDLGRGGCCAAWIVCHTNKKYPGAWYDYGHKTFITNVDAEDKAVNFKLAMKFAVSECKKTDWARTPFGGFVPVEDVRSLGIKVPESKVIHMEIAP